jgi:glutamate-1-semialdehyde 2,1-aminomutase
MSIPRLSEDKFQQVVADYEKKTPKSRLLHLEAKKHIVPMGSPAYMIWHRPYPIFVEKTAGTRVYDVDGNEYIDLFIDQGITFIGHKAPAIRKAIDKAMDRYGFHLEMCEELATEWAKKVIRHYPSIQKLKIVNTGNEATELVCQIARAFTGRNKIIKFAGHHHGWNGVLTYDALAAGAGTFFTKGIPDNHWDNLINLPPNDIGVVEKALQDNKDQVAAIVLEPLGASTGATPLAEGFQKQLRELCDKYNVLLAFDEVATGFRVALGGAQEILGVKPDLTCLGKPAGGGIPIGAVGGREDVMNVVGALDPRAEQFGPVFPMGSFCVHPLAMAAGIAFINELERGSYIVNARLRAKQLCDGINSIATSLKMDIHAHTTYTVVHFGLPGPFTMAEALDVLEFDLNIRLGLLLGNPGATILPGHVYMSGVHTDKDIQKVLPAFEKAFSIYKPD